MLQDSTDSLVVWDLQVSTDLDGQRVELPVDQPEGQQETLRGTSWTWVRRGTGLPDLYPVFSPLCCFLFLISFNKQWFNLNMLL